jgi:hypothetical protein
MGQLHDVFGDALDEPITRARLTLALAWSPPHDVAPTSRAAIDRRRPSARQRPAKSATSDVVDPLGAVEDV